MQSDVLLQRTENYTMIDVCCTDTDSTGIYYNLEWVNLKLKADKIFNPNGKVL